MNMKESAKESAKKKYYNQSGYLWHSVHKDPTPKTKHFRYVDKYNPDSELVGYVASVMTQTEYCEKYKYEGEELEDGMKGSGQVSWEYDETETESIVIEYAEMHKVNKYGKLRRFCISCNSIDCGQRGKYEVCTDSWHTEWVYFFSTKTEARKELIHYKRFTLNHVDAINQLKRVKYE